MSGKRPYIAPEEEASVPKGFIEIIHSCWKADPKERPSMQDIAKKILANKEDILFQGTDMEAFHDYVDRMTAQFPLDSLTPFQ